MKLASLAGILLLCGTAMSRVQTRSQQQCNMYNNKIQIFKPEGLQMEHPAEENLHSVAIKVYVNRDSERSVPCDVCANLTAIQGAKTIYFNSTFIGRHKDRFQYSITKRYHTGKTSRPLRCAFTVAGYRLKQLLPPKTEGACPKGSAIVKPKPIEGLHFDAEKALLEEIISATSDSCHSVSKTLILDYDANEFDANEGLKDYIVGRLSALLPSVADWRDEVENVYLSQAPLFGVEIVTRSISPLPGRAYQSQH